MDIFFIWLNALKCKIWTYGCNLCYFCWRFVSFTEVNKESNRSCIVINLLWLKLLWVNLKEDQQPQLQGSDTEETVTVWLWGGHICQTNYVERRNCCHMALWMKDIYTVSQRTCHPYFCQYVRWMLTYFKNSFTGTFTKWSILGEIWTNVWCHVFLTHGIVGQWHRQRDNDIVNWYVFWLRDVLISMTMLMSVFRR